MAEAHLETSPRRFFCHRCVTEVRPLLPYCDVLAPNPQNYVQHAAFCEIYGHMPAHGKTACLEYNCSRCNNGFIEELTDDGQRSTGATNANTDAAAEDFVGQQWDDMHESFGMGDRLRPRRRSYQTRNRNAGNHVLFHLPRFTAAAYSDPQGTARVDGQADGFGNPNVFLERFIQQMFGNVEMAFVRVDGGSRPLGGFSGVLGDYAFGPNGLDNIITQLLNQLDNSGPAPADKSDIDALPVLKITQKMINDHMDCAVCQDTYKLHDEAKKLPCGHMFHPACIDPWLELHDSCPICRSTLSGDLPKSES